MCSGVIGGSVGSDTADGSVYSGIVGVQFVVAQVVV